MQMNPSERMHREPHRDATMKRTESASPLSEWFATGMHVSRNLKPLSYSKTMTWALVRSIYIKFWGGRFIQTKIDLPPELMQHLKTGRFKIYLEDDGILLSGEADYIEGKRIRTQSGQRRLTPESVQRIGQHPPTSYVL